MALLQNGRLVADPFINATDAETIPAEGPVLVSLEQWQDHCPSLQRRRDPVGVLLQSDQHPEIIADDLDQIALVALAFPSFRDGRAYSYARLLRERYGFTGELRAVGDVLLEQLHYMQRCGFDAFDLDSDDPARDFGIAEGDFSVWYQPASDDRLSAMRLRHRRP